MQEVHVFWRADERDPFTYAGLAKAVEVSDDIPVKVRWRFDSKAKEVVNEAQESDRLPVETLEKVSPEHVWTAVQMLLDGYSDHQFAASTDYDLLAEGGAKLAPKAVFGVAAKLALGFEVLPKHFTGGEDSACFRLLRNGGFVILKKGESLASCPSASLGGPPASTWLRGLRLPFGLACQ